MKEERKKRMTQKYFIKTLGLYWVRDGVVKIAFINLLYGVYY